MVKGKTRGVFAPGVGLTGFRSPIPFRCSVSEHHKKAALILGLVVLFTAGVVAILQRDPEPQYKGHSLSWWLDESARDSERHDMYFFFVGAEAVPVLSTALARKDSQVNSLVCALWEKLPSPAKRFFPEPVLNVVRRRAAADALLEMGKSAASARPALIAALNDPDSSVRRISADVLRRLGP